ncbi:hypothetical protein SPF06_00925 [Sinomonas sp. JGH33]|uniref:Uncharacterized protein n=1 Tax=Sinomonas terricola TaxID=3110330 RepID=A0ABU5T0U3_9MICC|nr:hypothetical protein [Sinomonas sp. JGH33]MEA5453273.1 hypothetical protein [Sinomonas sp. JGH33]
MIFWLFLSILTLAVIIALASGATEPYTGGLLMAFMYALLTTMVGGAVLGAAWAGLWCLIPAPDVQTGHETHSLRALATSSTINSKFGGSFMLSYGYVKGERVLNYVAEDGSAVTVRQAFADHAVIYEDGGRSVEVTHTAKANGWLAPWTEARPDSYVFHVPAGSIQSDYTIQNQ